MLRIIFLLGGIFLVYLGSETTSSLDSLYAFLGIICLLFSLAGGDRSNNAEYVEQANMYDQLAKLNATSHTNYYNGKGILK